MNGSTAAWFALIGFLSLIVCGAFDPEMEKGSIKKGSIKKGSIKKGSIKAKALLLISIIGAFSCLIMVLQGFHLWGTYEPPIFDSNEISNISSKARGRGGIILLIIRIFPQFLVFGFGLWGWQLKPYISLGLSLWR